MFTQSFIAVACIAWMTLLFTLSVVVWLLDWWSDRQRRVVARRRRERREEAARSQAATDQREDAPAEMHLIMPRRSPYRVGRAGRLPGVRR